MGAWVEQTDTEPLDRAGLTWLLGLSIPSIAWGREEQVRDPETPETASALVPQRPLLYLVQSHSVLRPWGGRGG